MLARPSISALYNKVRLATLIAAHVFKELLVAGVSRQQLSGSLDRKVLIHAYRNLNSAVQGC